MSEKLGVLLEVAQRLRKAGFPYMVTGSLAVSFYGIPRMTRDVDIVLEASAEEASKVCDLFAEDFYVDLGAVREAIASRGMFNIIHNVSVVKVDFIIRKDEVYRRKEFQRRRTVVVEGIDVDIVAPEDRILSKLVWVRDSQSGLHLGDARNILKGVKHLDYAYMERWARRLGVNKLYQQVLK